MHIAQESQEDQTSQIYVNPQPTHGETEENTSIFDFNIIKFNVQMLTQSECIYTFHLTTTWQIVDSTISIAFWSLRQTERLLKASILNIPSDFQFHNSQRERKMQGIKFRQQLLAYHCCHPPSALRLSNIVLGLYLDGSPLWYVNFC